MDNQPVAYSILELALTPQGSTIKETLNNSLILAKEAESLHYTRFWFAEHHNADHIGSTAPSLLIGYIAENTRTLRVGSGGIMLPNHSPLVVAEQFGTLAHLYPNRIDLGLGRAPGTDRQTAYAIRSDFMEAAQSFPEEIVKIQQYFSKDNQYSKVRAPIAEGTDVPLYILGSSMDSAHLAAQKGLPYAFASHFASTHLLNALTIYRREFQASEVLSQPYTIAGVNVLIADTDEEAEQLFTTLIRMFLGVLTGSKDALQPPTEMTDELRQLLNHPTLYQMLKYSFVGSKATVKKQIQAFLEETQVNELIAVCPTYALEDRLKSIRFFAEVMEEINQGELQGA
ncbi:MULTISPECIES: LLM class flavin-dependent oxidoreductase [unclassified Siphonobacter]|uniref:LLM class flavin-dependent oxidoreductase n=1 Tax=unclassified Siphonobacter TaxID=2635712 RepID=UPI002782C4D6|nr:MULTISPECIES: LLM class flavin-dependent oxidoreductase [unclassified Siphonobacter]MDQ1085539.1 luciferase family oxidoreductase group 1 [Siphonobacter sp. SORGH_AS_1065]MDR6197379.1 luciferase family oxidoreductase group 1 [Siphonobacter sp. SORGH_AS_0500]